MSFFSPQELLLEVFFYGGLREMSQKMGVNPNTMARAYAELEREGFVFTKRGQGSFVKEETDRIDTERQALANGAVDRCIVELGELDLSGEQIKDLLQKAEGDLI